MTLDEIIRMARETGMDIDDEASGFGAIITAEPLDLERFAALVAAHEREKQAEQEPVAWLWKPSKPFPQYTVITDKKEYLKAAKEQGVEITPLYAAPIRTKDLTDDEIAQLVEEKLDTWNSKNMMTDFARAVIVADREKNK